MEASRVEDSLEDEEEDEEGPDTIADLAESFKQDLEELDAGENSGHEVAPKRKRWAEQLRRPLQRKPGRRRRDSDSDSDDEGGGPGAPQIRSAQR